MNEIIYVEKGIMNYYRFRFETIDLEINLLDNILYGLISGQFNDIHHNLSIYIIPSEEEKKLIKDSLEDAIINAIEHLEEIREARSAHKSS